ncbi:hypothetical protein JOM56_010211 [Amanita muscaria]
MNTIIIHPYNRITRTPLHDTNAELIYPTSNLFLKPTPWWLWQEESDEEGLTPIVEVEEEEDVEDVEEGVEEDIEEDVEDVEEVEEGVSLAGEEDIFVDVDLTKDDVTVSVAVPFQAVEKLSNNIAMERHEDGDFAFPGLQETATGGWRLARRLAGRLAIGDPKRKPGVPVFGDEILEWLFLDILFIPENPWLTMMYRVDNGWATRS